MTASRTYYREYYRKKYHEDPEFRERMIASVKKYQQTEKGLKRRKITDANFKIRNPTYNRDYCKKRRVEAIKIGMCIRCFKEESKEKRKQCQTCLDRLKNIKKARS